MIYIGEINKLKIQRNTSVGMYLSDKINNEVLLPKKYIDEKFAIGDLIDVFVYKDHEDRLVATTLEPYIQANEFAYLRVRTVTQFGAFLEWGMEKDLMVPQQEQSKKMAQMEYYLVYAYLDELTNRLVASSKINKFINNDEIELQLGDEVELMIFEHTFLGYNAIINNAHKGLIYHDEIFQTVTIGDRLIGYIKNIREDGGIDLSLHKPGIQHLVDTTDKVLVYLQKHKGFLKLNDDSTPDEIKNILAMSKKAFKKSIGILYKHRMIRLEKDGIYLNEKV